MRESLDHRRCGRVPSRDRQASSQTPYSDSMRRVSCHSCHCRLPSRAPGPRSSAQCAQTVDLCSTNQQLAHTRPGRRPGLRTRQYDEHHGMTGAFRGRDGGISTLPPSLCLLQNRATPSERQVPALAIDHSLISRYRFASDIPTARALWRFGTPAAAALRTSSSRVLRACSSWFLASLRRSRYSPFREPASESAMQSQPILDGAKKTRPGLGAR